MKFVIYDPPVRRSAARCDDVVNTPLSSCLLAGYAVASLKKAGFEAELIETAGVSPAAGWSVLILHLVYQWEYTEPLLEGLKSLKASGKVSRIFLFGFYPSAFHDRLLDRFSFIDGVVVGDPEETLVRLAARLEENRDWRQTRGVAFQEKGRTCLIPRPEESDLDRLAFPLRTRLACGTAYILGSRGCYGQCRFCTIHFLSHGKACWRGRSPENIVEEMVRVREAFGASYFYFADPNFCGPGNRGRERSAELARLIRYRLPGITFGMECRADNVEESLFTELREAGLHDLFLGVESFSQRMLERFRKGVTAERNIRAVKVLQGLGIHLSIGFIMFEKETKLEDVRVNFETLLRLDLLSHPSSTAHLLSHRVFLLRGTAFSPGACAKEYDAPYHFDEDAVQTLYETIYPRCRQIMREMDGEDFNDPGHRRYRAKNLSLVGFFEAALTRMEKAAKLPEKRIPCGG
ncbi:MAG: B12-binding domain-containing radical SAM protein [Deltaproteobacteria bacterium]|nr:B12-binding domain-containing radical SAM protein [Deltaproteobacteria bacterium]